MAKMYKLPPALKHGRFSALGILPGEDRAAFERLHKGLIAEFKPNGPLEEYLVARIARLVWRGQNLETLRFAKRARGRAQEIMAKVPRDEFAPIPQIDLIKKVDPAVREAATRAAIAELRKDLEWAYEFVEDPDLATVDSLTEALELEERLATLIERETKRLSSVKGLKSIISSELASPPRITKLRDANAA